MLELDIFNKSYIDRTPITGVVVPSDLNYLRRLYVFNKDSIQNYYQERNFSVKNTHILSRLLEHFPSYLQYDSYRYLEYASDKTKYLAKHLKFTSDLEKGVVHHLTSSVMMEKKYLSLLMILSMYRRQRNNGERLTLSRF